MFFGRFRPSRPDRPTGIVPLGLGLGLSSVLVVAGLGLRGPVLLGAVAPPMVAGALWRRRQRLLTAAAIAAGDLLDPWVLQGRLAALVAKPPRQPVLLKRWRGICGDSLSRPWEPAGWRRRFLPP